ncbi:MAG: hypothetical protein ABW168_13485 [Sedimenticola sp.]
MESENKRFGIKIDYERGSEDPGRVFRAMSGLIESMQDFDQHLAHTINAEVSTILLLEDIESGSVVTWLRNSLKSIPDEALQELRWKRIFGQFAYEARNAVVEWLEHRETISSRSEVQELQGVIIEKAERTELNRIPAYSPPPTNIILADVTSMKKALDNLKERDQALYLTDETERNFNHSFSVSEETVREILTLRTITSEAEAILQVKKPDYLGKSKWVFRYQGRQIEASVIHSEWLREFQAQSQKVLPGDSLRAILKAEISYGYEGEIVHEVFTVTNVREAISMGGVSQGHFWQ